MAGHTLNVNASLQCPHGGSVSISSSNQRAKADSASIATQPDTTTVSGCPFQKPAGSTTVPSPCVRVQWIVADLRVKANSTPALSKSAVGLCFSAESIPQGPVSIVNTQSKAQSQ